MIPSAWKGFIRAHERTFKKPEVLDEKVIKELAELPKNIKGIFLYLETRKARIEARNK